MYMLQITFSFTGSVCGAPIADPNVKERTLLGSPVQQATYVCKDGFQAPDNSDSYTNVCNEGMWENNGYCTGR